MDKSLTTGFGWKIGEEKKNVKNVRSRFRDTISNLKKCVEDNLEQEMKEEQDLCVNVCGCTVSVFILPDYPLVI